MDSVTEPKQQNMQTIVISLITGFFIWILFTFFQKKGEEKEEHNQNIEKDKTDTVKEHTKKTFKHAKFTKKASVSNFSHSLLSVTLKGHSGKVLGLDVSINGKYMASSSDDRSVRLWSVKDFGAGNKCVRVNVEFDHARFARFSPDSRAFIAGLAVENTVRVFKLGKNNDGVTTCIPIEGDFVKYNQFVASCGWTPDVKVWAVNFTRSGEYKDVTRAFELKGHTTTVWSFDFNNDSTRMVTVSKDGSWRFYDTGVEYEKGQEPYLLHTGEFHISDCSIDKDFCIVALSPDARVVAVACMNNIIVFSTASGQVEVEFKEVHTEIITALIFDIAGRYILSSGDKHVRVFHNVLGYKETIRELEEKIRPIPSASSVRERYQKQVDEAKKSLNAILKIK
uniref:Anaphase-promoting complex subunit 4 WD40 domain-containing protein n=1 Tax=Ciona savignyi TaxID=51511 RepID=H2YEE1_CIOSA